MVRRPLGNHHHGADTLLVTSHTPGPDPATADTEEDTEEDTEKGAEKGAEKDTEKDTEKDAGELRALIMDARFVLFDFDGPICRLFAGYSAAGIARELVQRLERQGLLRLLTEEERRDPDPQAVLHAVDRRRRGSEVVADLEERLTQGELKAVTGAQATEHADDLIRTWSAAGARLAVTTNNSARAAHEYLVNRGLAGCFTPHIYGRTRELRRQKPDPYHLNRALRAMGTAPGVAALMIGDSPSDLQAAVRAGVRFLGYARDERVEERLRAAGAETVVRSLEPVLRMLPAPGGRT
ncbi:HAD family hydrolase [Streptomyces nodosus]|uniref:HAD family hydrolase n=1 Tax=Streptomyces nodosus TaxID=40318 RepID=UPI0036E2C3EC